MSRRRIRHRLIAAVLGVAVVASACGDDSSSGSEGASGDKLVVGYSAWPGWFPLAVAEDQKLFDKAGVNVELKYFADYTASLDALVAGKIDVNAQTLNDTILGVSAGSDQRIVVVNDNSTGNDQVICDASITSIKGLKGKKIAAEAGVVDHFLLLQGLAKEGMTEKDVDFTGLKTDAAAAAFAGGQFDCVAVFAPFTVQALKRPNSKVLFSSADFPGAIPDHLVATADAVTKRPGDIQKLVNAWYATLDYMKANESAANKVMAKAAELSEQEYADLAKGTTLFTADQALNAFADRTGDATSLPEMARRINPFLVSSGLTKKEADVSKMFDPSFTKAYAEKK
ncbi:MAG: ABC transporter substrate-binding protein [Acidimicrobiia bacterium]